VLNLARVRLNDAIQSVGGDVLKNTAPFTQVAVNGAWRRFQEFLANLGYSRLNKEVLLVACPVVAAADPAIQASVNWFNYFDGSAYYETPILPPDFISPIKIWEKPTGPHCHFPLHPNMENTIDGLPGFTKTNWNRFWQWREDGIWMPGSLSVMDLRISYAAFLSDFITTFPGTSDEVLWYNQPVPIMRCLSPFASYIVYEIAYARGDAGAAIVKGEAEAETKLIFNRDVRSKQRVNIRRQAFSGHGRGYSSQF
jgi:hypothetical protein